MPTVANLIVEEPGAARARAMERQRRRQLENGVAGNPDAVGEVAIILAHEVALVEEPDGDGSVPVEQQCAGRRDADVSRLGPTLRDRVIDPRVDRLADEMQRAPRILDHVGPVQVHDHRAAHLHRGICAHRRVHLLHGVGRHAHVGVHQQHEPAGRGLDADVAPRAGTVVASQPEHPGGGPLRRHVIAGAVAAGDIDDRHAGSRTARVSDGLEGVFQRCQIVVRDDDHLDVTGEIGGVAS